MNKLLNIVTDNSIFQIQFKNIQIEITGNCNMNCLHCRASNTEKIDFPIEQIIKIYKTASNYSTDLEVNISGGEPMLHHDFINILKILRSLNCKKITITTNGTLLTNQIANEIELLNFDKVIISISLDCLDDKQFNNFRNYKFAFQSVNNAIELLTSPNYKSILVSIRVSLIPILIPEMQTFVEFAIMKGVKRLSFASIKPIGNAAKNDKLLMSKEQQLEFIKQIYNLQNRYSDKIEILTSEPLYNIFNNELLNKSFENIYSGCSSCLNTFNIRPNGDLIPCSLVNLPIMNILNLSEKQIINKYKTSKIVHNLLERNLKGKCGSCTLKNICGGCRARALANNDYLGEDPNCWITDE